jgi:hypothetical protein
LSVCHFAKGADTKGWMESGELFSNSRHSTLTVLDDRVLICI